MAKTKDKSIDYMKRYRKGRLWRKAILLTVMSALQTPYNTGTYSLFFLLIESRRVDWLLPFVILYVLGYVILLLIDKSKAEAANAFQAEVMTRIKTDFMKDAIATGKDSSQVLSFLGNDLNLLMSQYFANIFQLANRIGIIVFTLCLTLTSNWLFALIYLVLGLLPLRLTGYMAQKIGSKTQQYSDSVQKTTGLVKDIIQNQDALLNYNRMADTIKRAKERIFHSESSLAKRNTQQEYANVTMGMLYTVVNIIPIAIGIYMAMTGYLPISAFVAVQYSSGWIVGSLGSLAGLISGIKSTRPIIEKIGAFQPWEAVDEKEHEEVQTVEFDQVDFSYIPQKPILTGFSFKADKGSKILVQGASGSGKSTILKLISGKLKPTAGKVLLNGKELEYCKIGYVSQDPAMFEDTILYNLTLGKDFSKEKLTLAIEKAGLKEFIEEKGLDYELEESAANISGGQKQRIEIARALLYDCSVLLVDEGTSALDADTAEKIHHTIMNLDKTVIEVAHYIPEQMKSQFDLVLKLE